MNKHTNKSLFMARPSLSTDLVDYIKRQIVEGELNPGDRIVETRLARELGISQTPVREAIRLLSGEGIISIVPNKGPIIRKLDMKDVFELYSMRATLEGFASRLATENATPKDVTELEEFFKKMEQKVHNEKVSSLLNDSLVIHESIIRLANHQLIMNVYESISFRVTLANRILGRESTKQREVDQHRELVEALKAGDPGESEKVMRSHIYRSYCEFVDLKYGAERDEDSKLQYMGHTWF